MRTHNVWRSVRYACPKGRGRAGIGLGPVPSQIFYLPIHFVQRLIDGGLQPCPSVVREVPGKVTRLFQEHAHVAQLRELGFGHPPGFHHARSPLP